MYIIQILNRRIVELNFVNIVSKEIYHQLLLKLINPIDECRKLEFERKI